MQKKILFVFLVICISIFVNVISASGVEVQDIKYKTREQRHKANTDSLEKLLIKYEKADRQDTVTANVLLKLHYNKRYSDPLDALKYLDKAQDIYREKGLKANLANIYNLKGRIYFIQELYYLAMDNYFKCFEIMQELNESGAVAYSLNDIANTYYAQEIYDIPLAYYKRAAAIFKRRDDKFGLAVSYNNIALVKRNTGQLDSALYYFNQALLLRQKLDNPFLISHSYNYIGVIYFKKKEYVKALNYFYNSLDTIQKIKNIDEETRSVKAESYFYIAAVNAEQKIYDESYKHFLHALVIYESINDHLMVARTNSEIGKLKSEQNKYIESVKYLLKGLEVASKFKFQNEKRKIYQQLYDINNKNRKFEDALKYMKRYSEVSDSINDKKLANKLTEVQMAIQTYSKEKDIAFLRQRNREIKRISFAIVLFLSVIILFSVYYIHNRRKNEKRWKQLSNVTFEGVAIHENGNIIDCNNRFLQIIGYSRNEIKNKNVLDFLHPDCIREVREKISQAHAIEYETIMMKKDGTTVVVEILSRPSTFKGKNVRVAAIRDITQRKKIEEQLQKYTNELKELNATKDKFFSIIAHDLKNPFSSIIGFTELILEDIKGRDIPDIEQYIEIVNKSAKSAFYLLENLLEWSRSQTGKLTFIPRNISIETILHEEIGMMQNLAKQKGIKVSLDKGTEKKAFADENLVKTILRNLISNAIKFTPNDGKINLALSERSGMIEVCVSDTGEGIAKEDMDKLFRIDISKTSIGTSGEKGTGLGLILCKEFTEKNGGKIWVESESGKGSRFYFTLPLEV